MHFMVVLVFSLAVAELGARPYVGTYAPGSRALASDLFVKHDWTDPSDRSQSRHDTQVQQPLLEDAWKHLQVTAAPGRKTLAEASHIYVQHDWQKPSDDSLSTGSTQLQQPLLDDAWKHFKEDQDSSVKIQMLCDEQNPNMCPGNK
ncbi:hypothetical protein COO60DRAFT_1633107 [Scenedesmus sp. NREL 46B-D3]|nr:hypothetical protein COO60DRAFT_1633107 [Scenedesmus sp. NREL 46B-D3]